MASGYIWVEGTHLHWTGASTERRTLGVIHTGYTGTPGYIWIGNDADDILGIGDTTNNRFLHYVDASGDERICNEMGYQDFSYGVGSTDGGEIWIDDTDYGSHGDNPYLCLRTDRMPPFSWSATKTVEYDSGF